MIAAVPSSQRVLEAALALLYVVYYAWLLVAGHGMPYVMDGNESFSTLWHAYNLFHFDFAQSVGLTDESFSPHAAAHPYLYTHQGNFPRLFGFVIYALGARTIVSQVVATAAIVGSATMFLAYRYFARIGGPRCAAIYCALLMTDYVLYAQWHVVTLRVWCGFFVFALFLALESAEGRHQGRVHAALFLIGLGLFYDELAFAAMLAAAGLVYVALAYWRRPLVAVRALAAFAAGGFTALAILFAQLSLHFSVGVVLKDLDYTYLARNFASNLAAREAVRSFFEAQHIVFWPQYVNGGLYRNLKDFILSLSRYDLQVYTPVFCLAMLLLLAGWALGARRSAGAAAEAMRETSSSDHALSPGRRATDLLLLANLAAALFFLLCAIMLGSGVFGLYPAAPIPGVPARFSHAAAAVVAAAAIAALAGALAIVRGITGSWWAVTRMKPSAALRLVILLGLTAAALHWQRLLYEGGGGGELAALWMLPLATPWARLSARLGVAAALALGIFLAVRGECRPAAGCGSEGFARIRHFVVAGFAGYALVYWLSPGIVLSGFQWRYAPFVVFFLCALPAAAFEVLAHVAGRARAAWRERAAGEAAIGVGAAGLLLAGAAYWANVQVSYARLLPPDHGAVFRMLAEPPYLGRRFVSNAYTAPLTAFTGEWGYADTVIGRGGVTLTAEGYVRHRDMRSYLWFADRDRNADYASPDFYACFVQQMFASAALRRVAAQHGWQPAGGCSTQPLIAAAGRPDAVLRDEVVSRDSPQRDYWAVLRLDHDYPPFVRTLEAEVGTDAKGARRLSYRADAVQQENKPLLPPLVTLEAMPGDLSCKLAGKDLVTLAKIAEGASFLLPAAFTGTLAVRYVPRTATRSGEAVLSRAWRLSEASAAPCPWPAVDYSFADSNAPTTWKLDGWGDAEPWGTWTVGRTARMVPDIHILPDRDLVLTISASAFLAPAHPAVHVSVVVNDAPVGEWAYGLGQPDQPRSVSIPRAVLERRMPPEVRLDIVDPISPLELGVSSDERRLGLAVREIALAEEVR